ncbi:MAG TPA: pilus assembly protein TadG-related protein [Candidatus Baltobacteraceae bacterium]|nr:pilus assembly protein TadG-related protein [Candidatus Baltobacteraceae bacterium]
MFSRHAQRGQVLPLYAFGMMSLLALCFFLFQYATTIRWQVRAQTAADAAAAAALSVQTLQWNQEMMALHAASVEEYRIRRLTQTLLLVAHYSGGCSATPSTSAGVCATDFATLQPQLVAAVKRYGDDIALLHQLSYPTAASQASDANTVVQALQANCGTPLGGDCAFDYTMTAYSQRSDMQAVSENPNEVMVGAGTIPAISANVEPARVEVVVCKDVKPIIPSILGLKLPTFRAIGRAAATTAMVTEEWLDPGTIVNPATNAVFLPKETEAPSRAVSAGAYDWYTLNFGGNNAVAYPSEDAYQLSSENDELSAYTGWWSTIQMQPFAGPLNEASISCAE